LLHLRKVDEIFPNLNILDVGKNKIWNIKAVEMLNKLDFLAEVSFKDNPICVHKTLKEMVLDAVPHIEVVNQETLKDAGYRYKEELEYVR